VVTDGDEQVVVIDSGLQAHYRLRVVGFIGVFRGVGQGFVDGQREVINYGGGKTECSQPSLETRTQLARVVRISHRGQVEPLPGRDGVLPISAEGGTEAASAKTMAATLM
jgi:hypothetical protein